jgi:hypothetical protein
MHFIIEGKTPEELPERIISGVRLHQIDALATQGIEEQD